MAYLQIKDFPDELVARLDAAASLLGIKKEELATELLEDIMRDMEEFERKLRDERKRRLARKAEKAAQRA